MNKEKIIEKLESILKEEMLGRITPKDVNISKFKELENFFNNAVAADALEDLVGACREYLINGNKNSIAAKYLLGLTAYHKNTIDDKVYLKELVDTFLKYSKWALVELLSEKILENGENRHALKALGFSLERLKRNREAVPVWEELLKIDRFEYDIAVKLWKHFKEENQDKSVQYLRLAIEGMIKAEHFNDLSDLIDGLIEVEFSDLSFIDRIERQLSDLKQYSLVNELLEKYAVFISEIDIDTSINYYKRILENNSQDIHIRKKLVELYTKKYGDHSQFEHFMYISNLNNYRRPVWTAIKDFENNIVFDVGNYVVHRSWGLGEIKEMDKKTIIIDFDSKPGHSMSIQMALQSLQAVDSDHIYVLQHLEFEKMQDMFKNEFMEFFKILVNSYGDSITVSNIKTDLIPKYVSQKDWSKWWSKARTTIKKHPDFGFSDTKKDLIFMRERPISFSEELVKKFENVDSFSEHLRISEEYVNNVDEAKDIDNFVKYFTKSAKSGSPTKLVLSYFILKDFEKYSDDVKKTSKEIKVNVVEYIKNSDELSILSRKITSYDNKKEFLNLIYQERDDWKEIYSAILFELPLRVHRYIITRFIQEKCFNEVNSFVEKISANSRRYPEIFLWVFKNIIKKNWDYGWLDYSEPNLIIAYFRTMREIKKIEQKGNRLKNIAIDIFFGSDSQVLSYVTEKYDEEFLNKIYDMASSSDLLEEGFLEKMISIIKTKYPDYTPREVKLAEERFNEEEIYVLKSGFDKKNEELNYLVNTDMVNLQKDLSSASDVTSDLKENYDYNALLEKQAILKQSIATLNEELKQANIINLEKVSTESVNIGTTIEIEEEDSGENMKYSILGPWDVDFDNNVISYRSELAKHLLGKKAGDVVLLNVGDGDKNFKINLIEKYKA